MKRLCCILKFIKIYKVLLSRIYKCRFITRTVRNIFKEFRLLDDKVKVANELSLAMIIPSRCPFIGA